MTMRCGLDKDTGAAAKIALDLMGLGRSIARQGRRAEAVEYFQRAYSVSEGAGDPRPWKRPRRK